MVLSTSLILATISRIIPWIRQILIYSRLIIVRLALAFMDVGLVNISAESILEIFLSPVLLCSRLEYFVGVNSKLIVFLSFFWL